MLTDEKISPFIIRLVRNWLPFVAGSTHPFSGLGGLLKKRLRKSG